MKYLGIFIVILGAILLMVSYFGGFTDYNWFDAGALFIIILGILVHIVLGKKVQG